MNRVLPCILVFVFVAVSCGKDEGLVETVLSEYCRSRSEGQYKAYLDATGGDLLLVALRDAGTERRMVVFGSNLAHEGTVLVETYITSVEVDSIKRQASAVYLEKFGKGLKTWAVHHQSQLEYIDRAWRVITDRVLMTR